MYYSITHKQRLQQIHLVHFNIFYYVVNRFLGLFQKRRPWNLFQTQSAFCIIYTRIPICKRTIQSGAGGKKKLKLQPMRLMGKGRDTIKDIQLLNVNICL